MEEIKTPVPLTDNEIALLCRALEIAIIYKMGTYERVTVTYQQVKEWEKLKAYLMHEAGFEEYKQDD